MAKYAFFNTTAYGHITPTLPLVTELVSRGEQVVYYLTEEHRSRVEATGARFHAYPPNVPVRENVRIISDVIDCLCDDRPDFIVYDFLFLWGRLLARALQIPAITVRATYALNGHFSMRTIHQHRSHIWSGRGNERSISYRGVDDMQEQFTRVSAALNVSYEDEDQYNDPFDVFSSGEFLNICTIPRIFQPFAETFDERYVFVGSSILPHLRETHFPFEALDGRPLLYVALGTLFNDRSDIFKACIKAFGRTDWQVVLSRGRQSTSFALGPIPANFLVVNHAPQLEILSRASVFISHAGTNSVIESCLAGVPMVLLPQIAEQAITAERAESLGLGLALNPETVTANQLYDAVERIRNNYIFYKERTQKIGDIILSEGGYKRAADAILAFQHQQKAAFQQTLGN